MCESHKNLHIIYMCTKSLLFKFKFQNALKNSKLILIQNWKEILLKKGENLWHKKKKSKFCFGIILVRVLKFHGV